MPAPLEKMGSCRLKKLDFFLNVWYIYFLVKSSNIKMFKTRLELQNGIRLDSGAEAYIILLTAAGSCKIKWSNF